MSAQENEASIRRLNEEYWNEGNVAVLDQVFAADLVDHSAQPGLAPGREGLRQFIIPLRAGFSDIACDIDDLIAEGDKVAWRWTFHGTQSGPVLGIPATHKSITFTGTTIDRFAGGQIVERWSQADLIGLMQQLGVIPAPSM